MSAPIIRVHDVAFPRFSAPDLDVMQAFLLTFGMHTVAKSDEALYMRGTDAQHHVHVTHLGDPAFLGLAFQATRDELAVLAEATNTVVESLEEPGGGSVVHLTDPDGRIVDVVAEIEPIDALDLSVHASLNTGTERVRVDELQRVPLGASQVKRFGHAAIKTTSLTKLSQWYGETLGLLISDDMYLSGPEEPLGRFMRCDRGDQAADHHSLLILETGEVRLGHCAWEVADIDDLMSGHDHLQSAGNRHYWGIGRHVLGGQIFDYWKDPLGFTVEHWTDSDLLTASAPIGTRSLIEPINQWGPEPPSDLDF